MLRRWLTLGTLAAFSLSPVLVAAPAQAATISITCPGANTSVINRLTIDVNETLAITATTCDQFQIPADAAGSAIYNGVSYGPGSTVNYAGGVVTYIPPQARMVESQEISFINNLVSPRGAYVIYVTVTATDTPAQMWFQSIGREVNAVCEAGWGASWEQWPNGGAGGFTCSRQVVGVGGHSYSTVRGNPGSG